MNRSEVWEWDQYWHAARLAACDGDAGRNYAPAIQAAWKAFFEELGDKLTLVDIATGNGAVPLIAREVAREQGRQWTLVGTDLADINPAKYLREAGIDVSDIRFLPRTPAEHQPFPDDAVDVVTSQYGIEYTDIPATLRELARILRAGGRFQFIVHAAEGVVVANARHNAADADFLLGELDLFPSAKAMYRAVRTVESSPGSPNPADAHRAREAVADCQQRLKAARERMSQARAPDMFRYVLDTITSTHNNRAKYTPESILALLDAVRDAVDAHRRRVTANARHAFDDDRLSDFAQELETAGLGLDQADILVESDGSLLGWVIRGKADTVKEY